MSGHTDEWCKANCDPIKFAQLDKVILQYTSLLYSYVQMCIFNIHRLTKKFVSSVSHGYRDMPK